MRSHAKASTNGRPKLLLALGLVLLLSLALGASLATATAPVATIDPASEIGVTTAKATGTVNPEDKNSSWHFEFVSVDQYDNNAWAEASWAGGGEVEAGAGPTGVDATLEGLQPGTTYRLRLVAENEDGSDTAVAPNFEADPATAPVLEAGAATEVGYTKAKLSGTVFPEGGNVNPIGGPLGIYWELQYSSDGGSSWNYAGGGSIEGAEAESSKGTDPDGIEVQAEATGLQPGTTYEARLFAWYVNFGKEATSAGPNPSFETDGVDPPVVVTDDASAVTESEAHFSGSVEVTNADEAFNASCQFQYVTQAQYEAEGNTFSGAQSLPCKQGSEDKSTVQGSEAQPVAVEADATGLDSNTTYRVQLRAENAGGVSAVEAGNTFTTTAVVPSVLSGTHTPEGPGKTTVRGYVNPQNSALSDCHFSYGPTSSYGQSIACEPLPATKDEVATVTATITGLTPGATYQFQLSATNAAGTELSDDALFTSVEEPGEESCANAGRPGVGFLPDCRAWEMVSPPDKVGADVVADSSRTRAANNGDAVGFYSLSAFGDAQGTSVATEYIAKRSNSAAPGGPGWAAHAITPPQTSIPFGALGAAYEPRYLNEFSDDLQRGVFFSWSPLGSAPGTMENLPNLYLRTDLLDPGAGTYQLLSACPFCEETGTEPPPVPSRGTFAAWFTPAVNWVAPDGSRVAFESPYPLTADAAAAQEGACDYATIESFSCRVHLFESDGSQTRLVGRVPADAASETGCDDAHGPDCVPADVSIGGSGAGSGSSLGEGLNRSPHVISDGSDGHTRIFFTQPTNDAGNTSAQLDGQKFAQRNVNRRPIGRVFVRVDGTRTDRLNASEREGDEDEFKPAMLLDATPDGRYAFFSTKQALTDDAPIDSAYKLYRWNADPDDQGDHLTLLNFRGDAGFSGRAVIGSSTDGHYTYMFVYTQLLADGPVMGNNGAIYLWRDGEVFPVGIPGHEANSITELPSNSSFEPREARVTPNGRHMLFSAYKGSGLTGYDHGDCFTAYGNNCRELYLYSADSERLECVSCEPSGAPAKAMAQVSVHENAGAAKVDIHETRAISDDGRYVFFSTAEALVSEDTNGVSDAYVYNTRTGVARLLSSGTDDAHSYFLDASADGKDAFILTRERLVGWDRDTSYDLYDARVDGGFPEPAAVTAPCAGEACRGSAASPPGVAAAASAGFAGPGDPPVRRRACPPGKRRVKARGGKSRCVKQRAKRAKGKRRAGR